MSKGKGFLARLLNVPAVPNAASAGSREAEAGPWVPPEPMRLPMMCSAKGGWITLLAEERDTYYGLSAMKSRKANKRPAVQRSPACFPANTAE